MRRLLWLSVLVCLPVLAARSLPARQLDNAEVAASYQPIVPRGTTAVPGRVSIDTADRREGAGCLRFDIDRATLAPGSVPQFQRSVPGNRDWRGYCGLRYWIKVVNSDPRIAYQPMGLLMLNGTTTTQQPFRHTLPVGKWVQLTDSLVTSPREQVHHLTLSFYTPDDEARGTYSWLLDNMELVSPDGATTEFDQELVNADQRPPRSPMTTVAAPDGPSLTFDANGRITRFEMRRQPIYAAERAVSDYSGLLLYDRQNDTEPRPVAGVVKSEGRAVTQSQDLPHGLRVSARYEPQGDRLEGHVNVASSGPEGHPLTLYFALPMEAVGGTWWDDIRQTRPIAGTDDYWSGGGGNTVSRWSAYPFACVGARNTAVGLGVPMLPPRVQRTVYDPRTQCFYVAFDFYLTPEATKQNQTAEFTFIVYPADGRWGLRSAASKYYAYYPDYFAKRVKKEGGWAISGTLANNPNLADLGLQYHWAPGLTSGSNVVDSVRFDNEQGIYAFPYVEWSTLHVSMEGYERAGRAEIVERLRWLAEQRTKAEIDQLKYWFPYDPALPGGRELWVRLAATMWLKSLMVDLNGNLYGNALLRNRGALYVAKYIPINLDPGIPNGAGSLYLNQMLPEMERFYADQGLRMDGLSWDNFTIQGQSLGFGREHFAYAEEPLTFDRLSLQPAIMKDMTAYQLEREVAPRLQQRGQYLMANLLAISPVAACLAHIDVLGYEQNVETLSSYARTMAYRKPVCSDPVTPAKYEEPFVRDHLLYGIWPGAPWSKPTDAYAALMRRYVPLVRRECEAGWEPIPLAEADQAQVQVERFGAAGGPLLFSVKNHAQQDLRATITVRPEALDRRGAGYTATELVSDQPLSLSGGPAARFSLDLAAGQVCLVALAPPAR